MKKYSFRPGFQIPCIQEFNRCLKDLLEAIYKLCIITTINQGGEHYQLYIEKSKIFEKDTCSDNDMLRSHTTAVTPKWGT